MFELIGFIVLFIVSSYAPIVIVGALLGLFISMAYNFVDDSHDMQAGFILDKIIPDYLKTGDDIKVTLIFMMSVLVCLLTLAFNRNGDLAVFSNVTGVAFTLIAGTVAILHLARGIMRVKKMLNKHIEDKTAHRG